MLANLTTTASARAMTAGGCDTYVDYRLTVVKLLTLVILGLGSFLLGVLPLWLTKRWRAKSFSPSSAAGRRYHHHHHHDHDHHHHHHHSHPGDSATGSRVVSLLLCFGGGVLLYTTLVHLQPEVREQVDTIKRGGGLRGVDNLGDLLFCAGFFLVFFVDELAHSALAVYNSAARRSRHVADTVLCRSLSARRRPSGPRVPCKDTKTVDGDPVDQDEGGKVASKEGKERQQQRSPTFGGRVVAVERYRQTEDAEKQTNHGGGTGDPTEWKDDDDEGHSLRGFFTVLALSFHEIFEGMAIGLENDVDHVWYLLFAVATHKLVIAFCIGLELAWSGTRRSVLVVYVTTFAVVTPVGIAIGMAIGHYNSTADGPANVSHGPVAVVLQGLAAGTLLYVVFFEILARYKRSGWSHLFAIVIGFGLLLMLQLISPGHSHGPVNDRHSHNGCGLNHDHNGHDHAHDHGHHHSEQDHGHNH